MINKIINTVSWRYVIRDLKVEEIIDVYEKELQKADQKMVRVEKVIKRKGNKLNVK